MSFVGGGGSVVAFVWVFFFFLVLSEKSVCIFCSFCKNFVLFFFLFVGTL